MPKISIVIPAYNEEKRIAKTLESYLAFYQYKNTEIIVVLNGCIDNTLQIVKNYQEKFPDVLKYIDIKQAIGKGGAVHRGFAKSNGELIGFVDADASTSSEEYQKLIEQIQDYDGVIASRWHKDSIIKNRTRLRKLTSKLFIWIVKIIFNLPFTDTQCGAKVFKRAAILKILPELTVKNMAFDVELLVVALKNKLKIKEVKTVWVDKSSSAMLGSKTMLFKKSLEMFKTLLKIKKYAN